MQNRGFTLIELLIVVAIIAILAAIAVPNFLEAQTRAKVSAAQSDLRTIATAVESYRVDYNRQPREMGPVQGPAGMYVHEPSTTIFGTPRLWEFKTSPLELTTPVAYLTSLPQDPFKAGAKSTISPTDGLSFDAGQSIDRGYIYLDVGGWVGFESPQFQPAWANSLFGDWALVSLGPDKTYNPPTPNSFSDIGWVYDPTNGTTSRGILVRSGARNPTYE